MTSIEKALEECAEKGYYTCDCGNFVEADGKCYCGRKNPLADII